MGEDILGWIFGAGVAQGFFLASALLMLRVRNGEARLLLVAVILVFTLMLGSEFLDVIGVPSGYPVGFGGVFALAPALYLLMGSLAEDDPTPLARRWPHFVPFALSFVWTAWLYFGVGDHWVSLSNPLTRQWVAGTVAVKALYFITYAWLILSRPLLLEGKPPASRQALKWVRGFVWATCFGWALTLVSFLVFYFRLSWAVDSDYIGALTLVAAIYGLGYFALFNRDVLDIRLTKPAEAAGDPDLSDLAFRARAYLSETGAALNPDLSLKDMAGGIGATEAELSKSLSASDEGGFYALINGARLDAFLGLLDDPANRGRTVLDLAFEAGFNSKATFYRVFRARMGMTPKAYLDQRESHANLN